MCLTVKGTEGWGQREDREEGKEGEGGIED